MISSGIYEIVNTINGKRYVGSTTNFERRWREHRKYLRNRKHHCNHLQNAWNKHDEKMFEFRKILICASRDMLFYEQRCLDAFRPEYNIATTAGSRLGLKNSPETNARIGAANKGKYHPLSAESRAKIGAALRGRKQPPRSQEHIAKIKASKLGLKLGPQSPERRAKISVALLGRKMTPEQCAKNGDARRGRKLSPEHSANIGLGNLGKKSKPYKKHSVESNARKAEMMKGNKWNVGYKHSPEARINMCKAQALRRLEESGD